MKAPVFDKRTDKRLARELVTTQATVRRIRYLIETDQSDRLEPEGLTVLVDQMRARGDLPGGPAVSHVSRRLKAFAFGRAVDEPTDAELDRRAMTMK